MTGCGLGAVTQWMMGLLSCRGARNWCCGAWTAAIPMPPRTAGVAAADLVAWFLFVAARLDCAFLVATAPTCCRLGSARLWAFLIDILRTGHLAPSSADLASFGVAPLPCPRSVVGPFSTLLGTCPSLRACCFLHGCPFHGPARNLPVDCVPVHATLTINVYPQGASLGRLLGSGLAPNRPNGAEVLRRERAVTARHACGIAFHVWIAFWHVRHRPGSVQPRQCLTRTGAISGYTAPRGFSSALVLGWCHRGEMVGVGVEEFEGFVWQVLVWSGVWVHITILHDVQRGIQLGAWAKGDAFILSPWVHCKGAPRAFGGTRLPRDECYRARAVIAL